MRRWTRRDVKETGSLDRDGIRDRCRNHLPGCLQSSLEMNRLNSDKWQRPPGEQAERDGTVRQRQMRFQQTAEIAFLFFLEFVRLDKFLVQDLIRLAAQNIREAAGHAGSKIQSNGTEYSDNSSGHIFATMLSHALDNGDCAA